jgi:hypothetical protein
MGDAGEGLIDNESRIQERREEFEREREERRARDAGDLKTDAEKESLRLARTELERQLAATTHERRRAALTEAIAELNKRLESKK